MTDSNEDFVSFENALRDLKLQSEQLKKMVSQGDIRAFRIGESMQFRAEDVEALRSRSDGEDDLIFVDALEDDTGMVTEELSEEDTLLIEDDDLESDDDSADDQPRVTSRSRREALETDVAGSEPAWVIAAAILGFLALLWGALISWDITAEANPADSFATKIWAKKAK